MARFIFAYSAESSFAKADIALLDSIPARLLQSKRSTIWLHSSHFSRRHTGDILVVVKDVMSSPVAVKDATVSVPDDSGSHQNTLVAQDRAMIVRHGKWSLVGKLTNLAVALLNTALVARLVSPADYADLNSLRTLMTLIAIGLASGIAQWSLKQLGGLRTIEQRKLSKGIVSAALKAFAFLCGPCLAVSVFLIWLTAEYTVRGDLTLSQVFIAAFGAVFIGASELFSEIHRGLERPDKANLFGGTKGAPAATALFILLMLIIAVVSKPDFRNANSAFVFATLVVGIAALFSLKGLLPGGTSDAQSLQPHSPAPLSSEIIFASSTTSVLMLVAFMVVQGDLLIAGSIPDPGENSSYVGAKRCVQLITIPLLVVNTMASGIIVPLLSSNQKELLGKVLRGFCGLATIPALAMGVLFFFAPVFSLNLILGAGYSDGAAPLRILAVGQLVSVVTGSCGTVLILTGGQRIQMIFNISALVTLLCAGPALAMRFGSVGLSSVVSGIFVIHNIGGWYAAKRISGVNTFCSLRDTLHLRTFLSSARAMKGRSANPDLPIALSDD